MKKLILAQTDSSFPTSWGLNSKWLEQWRQWRLRRPRKWALQRSWPMTKGGLTGELAKYGRGGRWPWRADQKDPGGLATPSWWGVSSEIRQQGRSPLPQEPTYPPKKLRMGRSRGGKAFSQRAKARYAKLDDKRELSKEKVLELRFSQLSCKETFQCGRSVSQLVLDRLDRKVSLFVPFLRLTVFWDYRWKDQWTYPEVYRQSWTISIEGVCQDKWKDCLMVNVNLFRQNTLTQVQRFIQNSNDTDGRDVRLRKNRNDKRSQPLI